MSDAKHDRTQRLAEAAARRAGETEARARRALTRLQSTGEPITFRTIATVAQVSESYLYAHPKLAADIRRHASTARRSPRPAQDPSSSDSLRTKLTVTVQRVRDLEAQVAKLEAENATLRGEVVDLRRKAQRRSTQ